MSLKSKQMYHSINNLCKHDCECTISKQYINSLFGMMATKNITDEIDFTPFQFGLRQAILALDYDGEYCDTDSVKHIGNHNKK